MGRGWRTLLNLSGGSGTGSLGGRVGGDPVGMIGLDLAKLDHEFIVFGVADDGCIQDVVAMVVEVDLVLEFFVTVLFRRLAISAPVLWASGKIMTWNPS